MVMKFDELFEHRSLAASKLRDYIRDMGFTKVSFADKTGISRPTLDRLLNGSIDSKKTFDRHFQKILKLLNMSADDLMLYHSSAEKSVTTVYSKNEPADHKMSDTAEKQYHLLLDIIDLCTIYY